MNYQFENHAQNGSNLNEFTDQEIRKQLEYLGFKNISQEKFNQFKNDLETLISQEISINSQCSDIYLNKQNTSGINEYDQGRRAYSTSPTRSLNQNEKFLRNYKKVSFPDDSHLIEDRQENDEEHDSDQSFASIITTSSIVNNDNKVIKRKIIRKTGGQRAQGKNHEGLVPNNLNNSVKSREFDLHQNDGGYENNSEFDDDQDEQLMKLNDNYPPVEYPIKSFIRSQSSLSMGSDISRNGYYKSNPVNKFHEYKKLWNKQKVPGEKKHSDLRWSIREQMLTKDVIVKRQPRAYEPNGYTIPTDKKRQQLRWAVRSALANQF